MANENKKNQKNNVKELTKKVKVLKIDKIIKNDKIRNQFFYKKYNNPEC